VILTLLAWFAAVAVCYAVVRVFFLYPKPRELSVHIRAGEAAFLDAAGDVMFPVGGAVPVSGRDVDLHRYMDGYFDGLPEHLRLQIRALFFLFEHATIIFPAPGWDGMRRFSRLSPDQRNAVFTGWQHSRFFVRRLPFSALRAVLTMGYLGDPVVMRHLRVAPLAIDLPVCEADLLYPAVGARPDTIALGPEDLTPPSDGTPLDLDGPLHPDYATADAKEALS